MKRRVFISVISIIILITPISSAGSVYEIRPKDTLWSIAHKYNISVEILSEVNGLEDANLIKTGKYLFIPTTYKVKPKNTLFSLSKVFGVPIVEIKRANKIGDDNIIKIDQLLVIPTPEDGKLSLVVAVRNLLGVPYRYGGVDEKGVDCSGFIQLVFARNGIELPRRAEDQFNEGKPISYKSLQMGDILFFEEKGQGITHVGIYLDGGFFAHSSSVEGVSLSRLKDSYWRTRYIGARRILN